MARKRYTEEQIIGFRLLVAYGVTTARWAVR